MMKIMLDRRMLLLVLAGFAASAGGCIFQVRFDSIPPGADVYINDVNVGATPLMLQFNPDNSTVTSFTNNGAEQRKFDRATSREWWRNATVAVKLPGYEPAVRTLSFDGPSNHSFELKKTGQGKAAAPSAQPAVPAHAGSVAPAAVATGSVVAGDSTGPVVTGTPSGSSFRMGRSRSASTSGDAASVRNAGRRPAYIPVGRPVASDFAQGTVVSGAGMAGSQGPAVATASQGAQPTSEMDSGRVSIAGGLTKDSETGEPSGRAPEMGSIGFSFFSIDPNRASSIDHLIYGFGFAFPIRVGNDMSIDLLLDMAFANVVIRRNGPSITTDTILGFAFGLGLRTLLPRKMIPVDLGKDAWLRFGAALEVPFIYSMLKGDLGAFGYPTDGSAPSTTDYIFYGLRLSLFTELHGKAEWSKILTPRLGLGFDILWQGTVNGINFTRDGFPMLFMLGAKANIGKFTFVALDLNLWMDEIEVALSLDSKI